MKLAAATVVAKNAIAHARVLADSLRREHPDLPFFVLLADEIDGCFEPAGERFELLRLEDLGLDDLPGLVSRYSQQELTYAVTPSLIVALLDRGFSHVAFFKQESLVTGDLGPVFDVLSRHSIVLTPHLLTPLADESQAAREANILQSGVYNVGFLAVADSPSGRAFLGWWQERTLSHCFLDVAEGLHYEQRWLDLVPAYFDDVALLRDPGFNVAHWNLPERSVRVDREHASEQWTVDRQPCRYVRFSGFDPGRADRATRYSSRLTMADIGDAAELFRRYAALLRAADHDRSKAWPYAYYRRANVVRALARRARPLQRARALASQVLRMFRE